MPVIYVCPVCRKQFYNREVAREHLIEEHRDYVVDFLSKLSQYRIKRLQEKNIDPLKWAAGYLLAFSSYSSTG